MIKLLSLVNISNKAVLLGFSNLLIMAHASFRLARALWKLSKRLVTISSGIGSGQGPGQGQRTGAG